MEKPRPRALAQEPAKAAANVSCVEGRECNIIKMGPSPDRWKERSRTEKVLLQRWVEQWGNRVLPPVAEQLSLLG